MIVIDTCILAMIYDVNVDRTEIAGCTKYKSIKVQRITANTRGKIISN